MPSNRKVAERALKELDLRLNYEICKDERAVQLVHKAIKDNEAKHNPPPSLATCRVVSNYDLASFAPLMPAETRDEKELRRLWKCDVNNKKTSLFYRVNLLLEVLGAPKLEQFGKHRGFGLKKEQQSRYYQGHLENLFLKLIEYGETKLKDLNKTANVAPPLGPVPAKRALVEEEFGHSKRPKRMVPYQREDLPSTSSTFHVTVNFFCPPIRDPSVPHTVIHKQVGLLNVLAHDRATANLQQLGSGTTQDESQILRQLFGAKHNRFGEEVRDRMGIEDEKALTSGSSQESRVSTQESPHSSQNKDLAQILDGAHGQEVAASRTPSRSPSAPATSSTTEKAATNGGKNISGDIRLTATAKKKSTAKAIVKL